MFGGIAAGIGSIAGGLISAHNARSMWDRNYGAQKEFAQNGVRWKVEDAKRAGIHPLFALGASTRSFSPVQGYSGDFGVSDAATEFGQGISRAIEAKKTREEREREEARQQMKDVFELARFKQEQRYNDAQIRLIDSEIARNRVASMVTLRDHALPPAMPGSPTLLPGQGDAPPSGTKEAPYWDKSIATIGFAHDPSGKKTAIIPSDDMASRTEDKLILEWLPWVGAAFDNLRARVFGREVHGYWWHDDKGEYLPYPPKSSKRSNRDELDWRQARWNEHFPDPRY